jgi:hypothetical protein
LHLKVPEGLFSREQVDQLVAVLKAVKTTALAVSS